MMTVRQVQSDDIRLLRLCQLYLHEWSALVFVELGPDGLFVFPDFERWASEGHEALLFQDDDRLVGFALASSDAAATWHVEQFFISAGERRRGLGATAARALFARHPGSWTLTVRPENPGALAFWSRVVGAAPVPEPGDDGVIRQRFTLDAQSDAPVEQDEQSGW